MPNHKPNHSLKFEDFPFNFQQAIDRMVKWNSILVYEISKDVYGFTIIECDLRHDTKVESKQRFNRDTIPVHVQAIIDTQFTGVKCLYFPKGCFALPPYFGTEILTLCHLNQGYGFSIEMHSTDYGFIDGEKSKIAPACVHLFDENRVYTGILNITGPCPQKVSDIKEFRPRHEKQTPLTKHRKNIVKWANSELELKGVDGPYQEKYWHWAKLLWDGGYHW
jgi:hypothetical protein